MANHHPQKQPSGAHNGQRGVISDNYGLKTSINENNNHKLGTGDNNCLTKSYNGDNNCSTNSYNGVNNLNNKNLKSHMDSAKTDARDEVKQNTTTKTAVAAAAVTATTTAAATITTTKMNNNKGDPVEVLIEKERKG